MTKRKSKSTKTIVKAAAAKQSVTKSSAVRRRSGIALMCPADNGQSWNEITAGHLVIAQESAKEGWWEAIVIDRKADSLTLQFRDYPNLPKIVRHRSAIALMYRANEAHESEAGAQQA